MWFPSSPNNVVASTSKIMQFTTLSPEDEATKFLRKVRNHSPDDKASSQKI
jgi:hypothetical protein